MMVIAFRAKGYYVMVSQERARAVARALFLGDHTKDVAVSAPTVEEARQGLAQSLGVEASP